MGICWLRCAAAAVAACCCAGVRRCCAAPRARPGQTDVATRAARRARSRRRLDGRELPRTRHRPPTADSRSVRAVVETGARNARAADERGFNPGWIQRGGRFTNRHLVLVFHEVHAARLE